MGMVQESRLYSEVLELGHLAASFKEIHHQGYMQNREAPCTKWQSTVKTFSVDILGSFPVKGYAGVDQSFLKDETLFCILVCVFIL